MTTPAARGAAGVGNVRVAVATTRGGRNENDEAVGLGGWVLSGDTLGFPEKRARLVGTLQMSLPVPYEIPLLIALADGLEGRPGGARAARIAAEALTRNSRSQPEPLFALAHTMVLEAADTGGGCTAALLAVRGDGAATVSNVGDVRVYRVVDGFAGQLTVDDRLEAGTSGGSVVTDFVTRTVGSGPEAAKPHAYRFTVRAGDRIILCTSGVHRIVPPSSMVELSRTNYVTAATRLLREAIDGKGYTGENATVLVVDMVGRRT